MVLSGLKNKVPPAYFLVSGLLIIPAFLFQKNLEIRLCQAGLFMMLAALSGSRVKFLPNIIILISIVAANLFTPYGKILFSVGSFPVTSGALNRGLFKASALIGLVYLSRFSVASGLMIPGKFGTIIGKVFYYFERITEQKYKFTAKNFFSRLDDLIIKIQEEDGAAEKDIAAKKPVGTSRLVIMFLSLLIVINWAVLVLEF